MAPRRSDRRREPLFTEAIRISLLENDLDDQEERHAKDREEWKQEKDDFQAELSKIKWWMIGNFGALALTVLGMAIQLMAR